MPRYDGVNPPNSHFKKKQTKKKTQSSVLLSEKNLWHFWGVSPYPAFAEKSTAHARSLSTYRIHRIDLEAKKDTQPILSFLSFFPQKTKKKTKTKRISFYSGDSLVSRRDLGIRIRSFPHTLFTNGHTHTHTLSHNSEYFFFSFLLAQTTQGQLYALLYLSFSVLSVNTTNVMDCGVTSVAAVGRHITTTAAIAGGDDVSSVCGACGQPMPSSSSSSKLQRGAKEKTSKETAAAAAGPLTPLAFPCYNPRLLAMHLTTSELRSRRMMLLRELSAVDAACAMAEEGGLGLVAATRPTPLTSSPSSQQNSSGCSVTVPAAVAPDVESSSVVSASPAPASAATASAADSSVIDAPPNCPISTPSDADGAKGAGDRVAQTATNEQTAGTPFLETKVAKADEVCVSAVTDPLPPQSSPPPQLQQPSSTPSHQDANANVSDVPVLSLCDHIDAALMPFTSMNTSSSPASGMTVMAMVTEVINEFSAGASANAAAGPTPSGDDGVAEEEEEVGETNIDAKEEEDAEGTSSGAAQRARFRGIISLLYTRLCAVHSSSSSCLVAPLVAFAFAFARRSVCAESLSLLADYGSLLEAVTDACEERVDSKTCEKDEKMADVVLLEKNAEEEGAAFDPIPLGFLLVMREALVGAVLSLGPKLLMDVLGSAIVRRCVPLLFSAAAASPKVNTNGDGASSPMSACSSAANEHVTLSQSHPKLWGLLMETSSSSSLCGGDSSINGCEGTCKRSDGGLPDTVMTIRAVGGASNLIADPNYGLASPFGLYRHHNSVCALNRQCPRLSSSSHCSVAGELLSFSSSSDEESPSTAALKVVADIMGRCNAFFSPAHGEKTLKDDNKNGATSGADTSLSASVSSVPLPAEVSQFATPAAVPLRSEILSLITAIGYPLLLDASRHPTATRAVAHIAAAAGSAEEVDAFLGAVEGWSTKLTSPNNNNGKEGDKKEEDDAAARCGEDANEGVYEEKDDGEAAVLSKRRRLTSRFIGLLIDLNGSGVITRLLATPLFTVNDVSEAALKKSAAAGSGSRHPLLSSPTSAAPQSSSAGVGLLPVVRGAGGGARGSHGPTSSFSHSSTCSDFLLTPLAQELRDLVFRTVAANCFDLCRSGRHGCAVVQRCIVSAPTSPFPPSSSLVCARGVGGTSVSSGDTSVSLSEAKSAKANAPSTMALPPTPARPLHETISSSYQDLLVNAVIANSLRLVQCPFGNYIVQFLIEGGNHATVGLCLNHNPRQNSNSNSNSHRSGATTTAAGGHSNNSITTAAGNRRDGGLGSTTAASTPPPQGASGPFTIPLPQHHTVFSLSQTARFTNLIIRHLLAHIPTLSTNKFSSNVIEKCLRCATSEVRQLLIDELTEPQALPKLLVDGYANYVIQRAIATCGTPAQFHQLRDAIAPLRHLLKSSPFGSKIKKCLERRRHEMGLAPASTSAAAAAATVPSSTLHVASTGGMPPSSLLSAAVVSAGTLHCEGAVGVLCEDGGAASGDGKKKKKAGGKGTAGGAETSAQQAAIPTVAVPPSVAMAASILGRASGVTNHALSFMTTRRLGVGTANPSSPSGTSGSKFTCTYAATPAGGGSIPMPSSASSVSTAPTPSASIVSAMPPTIVGGAKPTTVIVGGGASGSSGGVLGISIPYSFAGTPRQQLPQPSSAPSSAGIGSAAARRASRSAADSSVPSAAASPQASFTVTSGGGGGGAVGGRAIDGGIVSVSVGQQSSLPLPPPAYSFGGISSFGGGGGGNSHHQSVVGHSNTAFSTPQIAPLLPSSSAAASALATPSPAQSALSQQLNGNNVSGYGTPPHLAVASTCAVSPSAASNTSPSASSSSLWGPATPLSSFSLGPFGRSPSVVSVSHNQSTHATPRCGVGSLQQQHNITNSSSNGGPRKADGAFSYSYTQPSSFPYAGGVLGNAQPPPFQQQQNFFSLAAPQSYAGSDMGDNDSFAVPFGLESESSFIDRLLFVGEEEGERTREEEKEARNTSLPAVATSQAANSTETPAPPQAASSLISLPPRRYGHPPPLAPPSRQPQPATDSAGAPARTTFFTPSFSKAKEEVRDERHPIEGGGIDHSTPAYPSAHHKEKQFPYFSSSSHCAPLVPPPSTGRRGVGDSDKYSPFGGSGRGGGHRGGRARSIGVIAPPTASTAPHRPAPRCTANNHSSQHQSSGRAPAIVIPAATSSQAGGGAREGGGGVAEGARGLAAPAAAFPFDFTRI